MIYKLYGDAAAAAEGLLREEPGGRGANGFDLCGIPETLIDVPAAGGMRKHVGTD